LRRKRTATTAKIGTNATITRLSTGDSTNITTTATRNSVRLATSIGTWRKNIWISVRSAVQRDITSPTDSSSWREKSSSYRWRWIARRMSCCRFTLTLAPM
jgi:hypothetical protein